VPSWKTTAFSYDARNRLTGTGFGDQSPAIGRAYTPDGLLASTVSNNSTWVYTYDAGRLLRQEQLTFGSTYVIGRSYDANAHLSTLTYPDGAVVDFGPNALGEATRVGGYATGVTYHPNGAVAGYTLGNGIVHTLSQNVRGLPYINKDAGVLQDRYSYDADGNITAIDDLQEGIGSRSMGYDGLDRLTAANAPGVWGGASYAYDQLNNLRASTVGARSSVHSYDATNRLTLLNTNGAYTGYAYDSQGNVTGRGSRGFYFDIANRMTLANGVASYAYDGHGRRTAISSVDGTYQVQVYSQGGQLLYGTRQNGMSTTATHYVYLAGKAIRRMEQRQRHDVPAHRHARQPGVVTSNDNQWVASRTRYEPYGNTAAGTVPAELGFTGQVNDTSTGLVYMQQRYYDPVAARFLSIDPVASDTNTGDRFNVYEYAKNSPYGYVDPDGREEQSFTFKLDPPTGSNIPSTVTITESGSVSTTNMGMSPGSQGSLATFGAHSFPTADSGGGNYVATEPHNPEHFSPLKKIQRVAGEVIDSVDANCPAFCSIPFLRGAVFSWAFNKTAPVALGPGFEVEVSYKDRIPTNNGTPGSSRADVIWGSRIAPEFAVEMKTGSGALVNKQIDKYRKNLPVGTPLYWMRIP
jgi:RHS repeat-associated protein